MSDEKTFQRAIYDILIDHDIRFTSYDASAERNDTVRQIFELPEMEAIRVALYQMIHHIDSEWGHDSKDLLAEWAEVFGLPDNVLAWIRA